MDSRHNRRSARPSQVDGGQRWKRHIDQLKDKLAPIVGDHLSEESTSERAVVDPDAVDSADETSDTPDNASSVADKPPAEPSPPSLEPALRRYPSRNRRPPEFYS